MDDSESCCESVSSISVSSPPPHSSSPKKCDDDALLLGLKVTPEDKNIAESFIKSLDDLIKAKDQARGFPAEKIAPHTITSPELQEKMKDWLLANITSEIRLNSVFLHVTNARNILREVPFKPLDLADIMMVLTFVKNTLELHDKHIQIFVQNTTAMLNATSDRSKLCSKLASNLIRCVPHDKPGVSRKLSDGTIQCQDCLNEPRIEPLVE